MTNAEPAVFAPGPDPDMLKLVVDLVHEGL